MRARIVVRAAAAADIQEAFDWYESARRGLGDEFLAAIRIALHRLASSPEAFPIIHRRTRRALVHRFPYSLLYRHQHENVLGIGCFHARRDPKIWRSRL